MKWWPLVWRSSYDELAKELAWQVHELNRKIEVIRADNEQLYKDKISHMNGAIKRIQKLSQELSDAEAALEKYRNSDAVYFNKHGGIVK